MSHCWWIGSLEKLTQDTRFSRANNVRGQKLLLMGCLPAHKCGPFPYLPLTGAKRVYEASPLCCRPDICKLYQEVTPACYAPWTVSQSDIFRQNLPSSRYETTAAPAWDKLYVDMILFCQYVIDICTLPTSNNKECKGPLCLYQRSEVNQSYLERSAKVSRLLHIHKAVFYPYFSFPYSIAATVFA